MKTVAYCTNSYTSNRCESPRPAVVAQCYEWETCMTRDPSVVDRAKVVAEMLAEVVNSFFEPISWKALVRCCTSDSNLSDMYCEQLFLLSSIAFFTLFVNAVVNLMTSKQLSPQSRSSGQRSFGWPLFIPDNRETSQGLNTPKQHVRNV